MAQRPLLHVAPVALLVPSGLVEGVKARFFSYGIHRHLMRCTDAACNAWRSCITIGSVETLAEALSISQPFQSPSRKNMCPH